MLCWRGFWKIINSGPILTSSPAAVKVQNYRSFVLLCRMQRRKSEANLQVPGQDAGQKDGENGQGNDQGEGGRVSETGLRAQFELISKLAMKGMTTSSEAVT